MNAGCDPLIAANWDALFAGQELTSQKLPPLVGESQFASAAASNLPVASAPLADEPTGNLAEENGQQVVRCLAELARASTAMLLVTHEPRIGDHADRVLKMQAGKIA